MISNEEFICNRCNKNIPLHNKKLHEVRCKKENIMFNGLNSIQNPNINRNFNNSDNLSGQISENGIRTNQNSDQNSRFIYDSTQMLEDQLNFNRISNANLNSNIVNQEQTYQGSRFDNNAYPTYIDRTKYRVNDNIPNNSQMGGSRVDNIQNRISSAMEQKEKTFSICPRCTEVVLDSAILQHMNNCAYKTCRFCFEYYPEEILKDHLLYCDKNPAKQSYEDALQVNSPNYQANVNSDNLYGDGSNQNIEQDLNYDEQLENEINDQDSAENLDMVPPMQNDMFGPGFPFNVNMNSRQGNNTRMTFGNQGGNNQSFNVQMNSGPTGTTTIRRTFIDPQTGQRRTTVQVTRNGPGSSNNMRVRIGSNHSNQNQVSDSMQDQMFGGLFDNFGVFSLFGQNPHDPLSARRRGPQNSNPGNYQRVHIINMGDDGEDDLEDLAEYANMIRVNRFQMFEPSMVNLLNSFLQQRGNGNRGMSENDVNRIGVEKYKKPKKENDIKIVDGKVIEDSEPEKCSVCLIEFEEGVEVRKLPCEHVYHPQCIDTWQRTNRTCPLCKRDIQEMI